MGIAIVFHLFGDHYSNVVQDSMEAELDPPDSAPEPDQSAPAQDMDSQECCQVTKKRYHTIHEKKKYTFYIYFFYPKIFGISQGIPPMPSLFGSPLMNRSHMARHRSDVAHCCAGRGSEGLGRGGVSPSFTTETTKSFRLMHLRCCSCSFFLQDRFLWGPPP